MPTLTETEPQEKGTHELVSEKLLIGRGGLSAATKTLSNPSGPWDNPNRWSEKGGRARIPVGAAAQRLRGRDEPAGSIPSGLGLGLPLGATPYPWLEGTLYPMPFHRLAEISVLFLYSPVMDQEKAGGSKMTSRKRCKPGPFPLLES